MFRLILVLILVINTFSFAEEKIKVEYRNIYKKSSKCADEFYKNPSNPNLIQICKAECNQGLKIGCSILGDIYSQKGQFRLAIQYYRKACGMSYAEACNKLGIIYQKGYGEMVKQDLELAKKYFKKACDLRDAKGCHNLANLYLKKDKDVARAKRYFENACNLGLEPACDNLTKFDKYKKKPYQRVIIVITDENVDKYYHKCFSGDRIACVNVGNFYVNEKEDYKKGALLYRKACSLGEPLGCNNLGLLFYYGYGVKQDFKMASEYFKKACDMGEGTGCNNLGSMYYFGYGVKKDIKKAEKYYEMACDMGAALGCENLAILKGEAEDVVISEDEEKRIYRRGCHRDKSGRYSCEEVIRYK